MFNQWTCIYRVYWINACFALFGYRVLIVTRGILYLLLRNSGVFILHIWNALLTLYKYIHLDITPYHTIYRVDSFL